MSRSKYIREYIFEPGVVPSDTRAEVTHWHGTTHRTGTVRTVFQRIVKGMLVWVIRWDTTKDRHIGKGVK